MQLCIFNPEHDLCLAKGRAHYVPPRSAVEFALRDAQAVMGVLYPAAVCCSVYDNCQLSILNSQFDEVIAWGWDAVVKHELLKRGVSSELLPTDGEIVTIRELQHRSTILPLQSGCHEVRTIGEMELLLKEREHWVMKAPWSGAGRGLRWVHGAFTPIDRDWMQKTISTQRCVIVEPNRLWIGNRQCTVTDVALEYIGGCFAGYSLFRTGSGVYKENVRWKDDRIETEFRNTDLQQTRAKVEGWLKENVWPHYCGPLGIDLMVSPDGSVYVAEMNVRHTMGMVAHAEINK